MKNINVSEITSNIREMCIEINHELSPDMEKLLCQAADKEKSLLGVRFWNSSGIIWRLQKVTGFQSVRIRVWQWFFGSRAGSAFGRREFCRCSE